MPRSETPVSTHPPSLFCLSYHVVLPSACSLALVPVMPPEERWAGCLPRKALHFRGDNSASSLTNQQ